MREMSRLGVVRWLEMGGNSSTNTTFSSFSPGSKDEWLQADIFISVCMLVVMLIHANFCSLTKMGMSTLFTLMSLVITLILAPGVGAVLMVCALYRHVVSILLKVTIGPRFYGLLDGTDAFWAIEDDTSLSIINVLALADFSFIVSASTQGDEPLETITDLIQERLLGPNSPFHKLMCFRTLSRLGYFYWEKQETINIANYIRWMDIEDQGDGTITESYLKNFVSSVLNSPLPANHAAGWEILVGRYPIKPSSDLFDAMENGGWITKSCAGVRYPVLFRIHHSIGDGVALVNLMLDSLADPSSRSATPLSCLHSSSPSFNRNFLRCKTPTIEEEPEESPIVALWHESDITKFTKSTSCDFSSICLNIPMESSSTIKKSNTYNFGDYEHLVSNKNYSANELKSTVKSACMKFLTFIKERKEFNNKLSQRKMNEFDIVVNNRPSGEFLDLMNTATRLESQFESKPVQDKNNKCMYFLNKSTTLICMLIRVICRLVVSFKGLINQWSVLLFAPASLLNQALTQTQDVNILHGPQLSGHKVVAWYIEQQDNSDQLLMSMIKRIRAKTGVRFSDVLLTALSASLESFYGQCNEIPEYITVVIPGRLGPAPNTISNLRNSVSTSKKANKVILNSENKLENKFSVAMLPLPIASKSSSKLKLFMKLREVRRHCERLRNSPDYLVNYWLLRVVATLLPTPLLQPLVTSSHCTLVLSNVPGPARLTHLAGHTLHDLVFWVPNRTTTGVGVTVLSYAGRLQLGLMADRALVACQQDAQSILDGIASAIYNMDQVSSPA